MSTTKTSLWIKAGLIRVPSEGLIINSTARGYIGTGNVSARGSIVGNTVLNTLLDAMIIDGGSTSDLYIIGSTTIPALGNSFSGVTSLPANRLGFINVLAKLAETEFPSIANFVSQFNAIYGWKSYRNTNIRQAAKSKAASKYGYSNQDDLYTSDVTGVNKQTSAWGQDLYNLNYAIDLSKIKEFGKPSVLFRTISERGLVTSSLRLALATVFSVEEIEQLLNSNYTPTTSQESNLYTVFQGITNYDLEEILLSMLIRTQNLTSLADLLNPVKLFPNSYSTLTMPVWQTNGDSSKVYYFIYTQGSTSVNPDLKSRLKRDNINLGDYLIGILPDDLAQSCAALSMAMMQIPNIDKTQLPYFAVTTRNLLTVSDLPRLTISADPTAEDVILAAIAKGSGPDGTFVMTDFFGAASGIKYNSIYAQVQTLIQQLQTSALSTAYNNLVSAFPNPVHVAAAIATANAEIQNIQNRNPSKAAQLNTLWTQLNTLRSQEETARAQVIGSISGIPNADTDALLGFADSLDTTYYLDTMPYQAAAVITALSDRSTVAGQAIVGKTRENINRDLLQNCGINPDAVNAISGEPDESELAPVAIPPPLVPGMLIPEPPQPNPLLLSQNQSPNLSEGQYDSQTAAQSVIDCNCDCWET